MRAKTNRNGIAAIAGWVATAVLSATIALATAVCAEAVELAPGDIVALEADVDGSLTYGVVFRIDPAGIRTVVSTADNSDACFSAGSRWSCCTGAGTHDGSPPCAAVGSGPDLGDGATETSSDLVLLDDGRIAVSGLFATFLIDPESGDRSILMAKSQAGLCSAPGTPFACCTGSGTGDGTLPCIDVGGGDDFSRMNAIDEVLPPSPDIALTLPTWAMAALVGLLVGLLVRHRSQRIEPWHPDPDRG